MTYEKVSGSFETTSCFRNVRTLHELACGRKVVTRSLTRFLLVHATCRHMRTEQKGMQSHELACAHKKRSEISGETRFFGLVARPERRAFHGCQGHSGLGRACNMKVCVGVSKLRLLEHILLLNSWPSRCPSYPSSPPSFPHATFRVRGTRSKNEIMEFFFSRLVQIE